MAGESPGGESIEGDTAIGAERAESWIAGEGRVDALWQENLGSTKISCVGELSRSATWPSEPTPAHVPSSAMLEARAANIQCAALLAALSLARFERGSPRRSLGVDGIGGSRR
jgi:hypothetical protein